MVRLDEVMISKVMDPLSFRIGTALLTIRRAVHDFSQILKESPV